MKAELLSLCLALLGSPVAALPCTPPGVLQEEGGDARKEWRGQFLKAMRIGARAEMQKLVKRNDEFATEWIVETAESIANAPNDELYERMTAFRVAWKGAIGTKFCEKMEVYFSLLDPPIKRVRARMRSTYGKKSRLYNQNLAGEMASHKFTALGVEFEGLAKSFNEIGDHFYASRCFLFAGNCFEETTAGKKQADLKRVCANYEKYFHACDQIELKDKFYILARERYGRLEALGFASKRSEGETGEVEPDGAPAEASGGALAVAMTFEMFEELDAVVRPSYFMDDIHPVWNALALNKKGSRTVIPRVENGPDVLRLGSSDVWIDTDRDGEGDVKVPLRGRQDLLEFEIGEGESKRKWGMIVTTGNEQDSYQNVEVNLGPTDDVLSIYYAPAASMKGEIAGVPVQVFDDNLDGVYGSLPVSYGHIGLTKDDVLQPEMDSILIDGGKRARPWSEYQKIGEQWYRLEVMEGGKRILATPQALKTGSLKLKYKGPKASFVIVRGENAYENSFFDIGTGKAVEVPLGRYELFFGLVTKGKNKQLLKALMLPSDGTPSWDVLIAGEELVVELGSPFGFDFDVELEEDSLTVPGSSVCVVGKALERYERVWGAVSRPEVSYRKSGARRGSKSKQMGKILDQNEIYEVGWKIAWFPRDLLLKKKKSESEVEVQLKEKKNKLFGKIESNWK